MHCIAKIVVVLLSLLGLGDISCRLAFGEGSVSKFQDALVMKFTEEPEAFRVPEREAGNPWEHFARKCEMMKPIVECHRSCGQDHACHTKCPMPQRPRMQAKARAAIECHGACREGDHACRHACARPLFQLIRKCEYVKEKMECHKACMGDRKCHRHCGGFRGRWWGKKTASKETAQERKAAWKEGTQQTKEGEDAMKAQLQKKAVSTEPRQV